MTEFADFLYVVTIAIVWPLVAYFASWPRFLRHVETDPVAARTRFWTATIIEQWVLTGVGILLWLTYERSLRNIGFVIPSGWRLWVPAGLIIAFAFVQGLSAIAVSRSETQRARVQKSLGALAVLLPRNSIEFRRFVAVSVTAGICEEFLFRGYLIWFLSSWTYWWAAATVSVFVFTSLHAYQGIRSAIRTGIVGAVFTAMVGISGSLYPAMAAHVLLDVGSGYVAWISLRDGTQMTA